jgi:hypothetical protein
MCSDLPHSVSSQEGSQVVHRAQKAPSVLAPCAIFFLAYAGVIVWWLHDWIQILLGHLPDADGVSLYADL